jgi:hypothetical protein
LSVIQYYGSGDFGLEYCSNHGRVTIGHTGHTATPRESIINNGVLAGAIGDSVGPSIIVSNIANIEGS